ncbi:MAG: hypothetical protein J6Q64_04705 [Clostridia bacterium]|nr:hypothetical protein [Clostridia bacterium]
MEPIKCEHGAVKMVAHRGAGKVWVENSLPAFRGAAARSYWGIETDVHVTADGKYIITHDDNTQRVTGESYVVEETDFATLRSLRLLGLEGDDARLPTLEEYYEICKAGDKYAVLELKKRMTEQNIAEIIEIIRSMDWLDRTVFISFSMTNLETLERLLPGHPKQFLFGDSPRLPMKLEWLDKHPTSIDVDCRALTAEMAEEAHAKGFDVNVWTINTEEQLRQALSLGVDFITTDIFE